ncbi:MmpS family transport accessory protein, partial [Mycolicibacter engbaekii]|uniref:MmpS family transport accessory protein n=1 Tax=Mycolicibacter engbaekii TaxID=188915 RepID=UPI001F298BD6
PPPPPPPAPSEEPTTEPPTTTQETTTTTPAKPLQVTYSVTGTKAPFDQITITYVDASGQRRTQRNAYIPWSLTLTPISQSEIGAVEATSMLRLSKLNCSITSSDGRVLFSNSNDAPATSCG